MKKNKPCIDCGKLIWSCSTRCSSCSTLGERNPAYKHGKSYDNKCLDCGNKIDFSSVRCKKCAAKGERNPNYKHGNCKDFKPTYEQYWKYYLKRNYDMSPDSYKQLLTQQNNKCAICKKLINKKSTIDHDHSTNRVRGVLCYNCNILLGAGKDSIEILENAIRYLKANKSIDI
jgi:hypothetical protein